MSSKESLGNLCPLGQKIRPKAGRGECALGIWKGYNTGLVLCGLRALMDGERVAIGTVSPPSLQIYGSFWMASGGGDRGTSGWIEQHVL